MANAVTFSVTAMPKSGANDSFRDNLLGLHTADLKDCILSVFHIGDSYALLSGEALPTVHTTSNTALRRYLLDRLTGDDGGLDFDVKIDLRSESGRSRSLI